MNNIENPASVKSLPTTTLESQPPANKRAESTPQELDYDAICSQVGTDKSGNRHNLAKGNGLFSAVCQVIKSKRGQSKAEKLPDWEAERIETAVHLFKKRLLEQVTTDNLTSVSNKVVLRNGEVQGRVVIVGHNAYTTKDQVFLSGIEIGKLDKAIEKARLDYKDTTSLERRREGWLKAKLWAEYQLEA
jgi:hypothetical protein